MLTGVLLALLIIMVALPNPYILSAEEEIPYGGTFKVGWLESLETFTMGQEMCWSLMGCAVLSTVYEELAFMGKPPNYDIFAPRLAVSWDVSEDRTEWTFHLDPNAKFHDGTPVTAEDVAFTAKYLIKIPVWNGTDTDAKEVIVVDEHTVKLVMKQPIILSVPLWWVPILPKHIWEPYKDNLLEFKNEPPIGSGPFMVDEWKFGEYIKLKAFEDYHLGRPYIDYLIMKTYGSEDALVMALLNGEIDMIEPCALSPSGALQIIKANNPNVAVRIDPGDSFYWLELNQARDDPLSKALRNVEFRRALAHAIDKEKIAEVAFIGYADPVDVPVYKESDYYNPNIKTYEYDIDLANQILDNLGYKDIDNDGIRETPEGQDLVFDMLIVGTNTYHVKIATCIKEDFAQIGIGLNVHPVDESAYWEILGKPPAELEYHIILFYEAIGPDIVFALEPLVTGSWANFAGYSNPEYDDLFNKFTSEPDHDKRVQIVHKMLEIISEDIPFIYLVNPNALTAYRTDKFEGFVFGVGGAHTWFSPWTYWEIHLKPEVVKEEVTPSPQPQPTDYTPWIIAGVAIIIAIIAIIVAVIRRK